MQRWRERRREITHLSGGEKGASAFKTSDRYKNENHCNSMKKNDGKLRKISKQMDFLWK